MHLKCMSACNKQFNTDNLTLQIAINSKIKILSRGTKTHKNGQFLLRKNVFLF